MTAPSDIFNVFDDVDNETSSRTVQLPDVHGVLVQLAEVLESVQLVTELATGRIREVEPALAERIERNRRRAQRARRNGHAATNGNGHRAGVALKLTSHGFMTVCKRCGKQVA